MSAYLDWHVGMKVVAVGGGEDGPRSIKNKPSDAQMPKRGSVYTIRQMNMWPDGLTILLEELDNSHLIARGFGTIEPGFNAAKFRPVQTRKTDISIFTALLNPSPADRADIELEDFVLQHSAPMQEGPSRW